MARCRAANVTCIVAILRYTASIDRSRQATLTGHLTLARQCTLERVTRLMTFLLSGVPARMLTIVDVDVFNLCICVTQFTRNRRHRIPDVMALINRGS